MWTLQSLPREYCRMRSGTTFVGSVNIFLADKANRSLASVRGNYVWSIELVVFPCPYCTCIVPGNWLQPINLFFSLSILLQKSVMHVQSCCFANQSKPEAVICFFLNLLLFCRSRCRHRRHCLTLITPTPPTKHRVKKKKRFECGQCCLHHGGVRLLFHSYHLFLKSLFITAYNRSDKDRYSFSKLPNQGLMIYRRSHVTWAHTAHHDFFNFMSGEPTQRNIFFFFFV